MNAAALDSEAGDRELERKTWSTLTARAALQGLQLWRTDAGDGPQRFVIARAGVARVFADRDELDRFLDVLGAA